MGLNKCSFVAFLDVFSFTSAACAMNVSSSGAHAKYCCSESRLVDDGSWCDLQPVVARAELCALFPDRGVNGFPYRVVREERRRFFQAFSVGKLGCSRCCQSRGAVCHFPSSPWAGDREMDDICSLAALLPQSTQTHTETQPVFSTHTHTHRANKNTPTHRHSLLLFLSSFTHMLSLPLTDSMGICLITLLLPLATKPISNISRGNENLTNENNGNIFRGNSSIPSLFANTESNIISLNNQTHQAYSTETFIEIIICNIKSGHCWATVIKSFITFCIVHHRRECF